jgi:hydroxymethylbilane synthase
MAIRKLVVASRGSNLALRQAETVADFVRSVDPEISIEIRTVKTTGDRDRRSFARIGGKGLFVAEVEREVAEGRADVAVHSAKDLTGELGTGCRIICIPTREAVNDVVVGGGDAESGEERLSALPPGASVGTSSSRRRALVAEIRPDLELVDLRGNLDTRLAKIDAREVDAAVLAAAGITRLGRYEDVGPAPLDADRWVTAPGQGALAVEALGDRDDLVDLFVRFTDHSSWAEVTCERAFSGRLEGGCSIPLGCWARVRDEFLTVTGYIGHPDGSESIRDRISGGVSEAESLGRELAAAMLRGGGADLLADVRDAPAGVVEPP